MDAEDWIFLSHFHTRTNKSIQLLFHLRVTTLNGPEVQFLIVVSLKVKWAGLNLLNVLRG